MNEKAVFLTEDTFQNIFPILIFSALSSLRKTL